MAARSSAGPSGNGPARGVSYLVAGRVETALSGSMESKSAPRMYDFCRLNSEAVQARLALAALENDTLVVRIPVAVAPTCLPSLVVDNSRLCGGLRCPSRSMRPPHPRMVRPSLRALCVEALTERDAALVPSCSAMRSRAHGAAGTISRRGQKAASCRPLSEQAYQWSAACC